MCYIVEMAQDAGLNVRIGPVVDEDRQREYTFYDQCVPVGKVVGRPAAVEFIYAYKTPIK